jgi:hypothetical protein
VFVVASQKRGRPAATKCDEVESLLRCIVRLAYERGRIWKVAEQDEGYTLVRVDLDEALWIDVNGRLREACLGQRETSFPLETSCTRCRDRPLPRSPCGEGNPSPNDSA